MKTGYVHHKSGEEKLRMIRELMKNVDINGIKGIHAYIIPTDDAHQSEYIRKSDKRREYISGFTGSAGTVVVTENQALLWTDGRYFTQANLELTPPNAWTLMKSGEPGVPTMKQWLSKNLPENAIIGADPDLLSFSVWTELEEFLSESGKKIVAIDDNLVDLVWGQEKPIETLNKIVPHEIQYTGRTAGDKIKTVYEEMDKKKVDFLIITKLDEIAYLLNWRGTDIPYNPVFFSYLVVDGKEINIFVDSDRVTEEALTQLKNEGVDAKFYPYNNVKISVRRRCFESTSTDKIWISYSSSYSMHAGCLRKNLYNGLTPGTLMKLVKNPTEVNGMRIAYIRDSVALVKYFAWLENALKDQRNYITESSSTKVLENFRK